MRRMALLTALVLLSSGSLSAQWKPLTARVRQIEEYRMNDELIRKHVREGRLYRITDGSTLVEWDTYDGEQTRQTGDLIDNKSNITYTLNLVTHTAVVRSDNLVEHPWRPIQTFTAHSAYPSRKINGVPCSIFPLQMKATYPPTDPLGEMCWSSEYRLMVRWETMSRGPGARVTHNRFEAYDVQSASPDLNLFDLQARGFQIIGSIYSTAPAPPPQK